MKLNKKYPLFIEGEIRKYKKELDRPNLTFDKEIETTDKIDKLAREYNDEKFELSKKIQNQYQNKKFE